MKKYILGSIISTTLLFSPALTQRVHAAGLTQLQISAIIQLLQSFGADQGIVSNVQISLSGGVPTTTTTFCYTFNTDLTVGSSGADVSALNQALSISGINTSINSSNFTEDTAADVVSFQAKYGIRQTGYVGPITRGKLNALYGCQTVQSVLSTKFSIGSVVRVTGGYLNVRSAPSTSGALLGTQPVPANQSYDHGIVVGGPISANDYIWWNVDYHTGPDGWGIENYLGSALVCEYPAPPPGCNYISDPNCSRVLDCPTPTPTPLPTLTLLSPNGGESYTAGATIPISFITTLSKEQTPGITFQLYRGLPGSQGSSYLQTITSNWLSGSPYQWRIPSNLSTGQYSIYIAALMLNMPTKEGGLSDWSNSTFTVINASLTPTPTPTPVPSITLLSPNGGEMLTYGAGYPITARWKSQSLTGSVAVYLAFPDGALCRISSTPSSTEELAFVLSVNHQCSTVPRTITPGSYKVALYAYNGNSNDDWIAKDMSDGYITLILPDSTPTPTPTPIGTRAIDISVPAGPALPNSGIESVVITFTNGTPDKVVMSRGSISDFAQWPTGNLQQYFSRTSTGLTFNLCLSCIPTSQITLTGTGTYSDGQTASASTTITVGSVTPTPAPLASCGLDVDRNGVKDALSDGILIQRYFNGYRGTELTSEVTFTDASTIETYIAGHGFDVDGNGIVTSSTDGMLILRYLFGFTESALTSEVIGSGATRTSGSEILAWLNACTL